MKVQFRVDGFLRVRVAMIIRNEWDQLPALPTAVLAVAVVGSDGDSTD